MAQGNFATAEQLWEKLCKKAENENIISSNKLCVVIKVKSHPYIKH